MSIVSRIFVVINMLLAFSFMIASLVLYSKKIHWVEETRKVSTVNKELQDDLDQLTDKYDVLQKNSALGIASEKSKVSKLQSEVTGLRADKNTLTKSNTELRSSVDRISDNISDMRNQLSKSEEQIQKLQDAKETAEKERNAAQASMEFSKTQAIEVTADLKEAEAQLMELSKRNAELVREMMKMSSTLEKARASGAIADNVSPSTPIAGRVLKVADEVGIIILNIGESDNVKPGMEFVISRGEQYVGKVRVRTIYQDMCSAIIIPDLTKGSIEVSDMAQTM